MLFFNDMRRLEILEDGMNVPTEVNQQRVHIAYSLDRGRSFERYAGNPILAPPDRNYDFRDPSVFWHDDSKRWIMLVCRGYTDFGDIFASSDSPRTTITTFDAYSTRYSAACPAELPAPTIYAGWSWHEGTSLSDAP